MRSRYQNMMGEVFTRTVRIPTPALPRRRNAATVPSEKKFSFSIPRLARITVGPEISVSCILMEHGTAERISKKGHKLSCHFFDLSPKRSDTIHAETVSNFPTRVFIPISSHPFFIRIAKKLSHLKFATSQEPLLDKTHCHILLVNC
jgi:hypothetical protein